MTKISLTEGQLKRIIKESLEEVLGQKQQVSQGIQPGTEVVLLFPENGEITINGAPAQRGLRFRYGDPINWGNAKGMEIFLPSNAKQYMFTPQTYNPSPQQQQINNQQYQQQQKAQRKYQASQLPIVNKFVPAETQANLYGQAYPGKRNPHIRRITTR